MIELKVMYERVCQSNITIKLLLNITFFSFHNMTDDVDECDTKK